MSCAAAAPPIHLRLGRRRPRRKKGVHTRGGGRESLMPLLGPLDILRARVRVSRFQFTLHIFPWEVPILYLLLEGGTRERERNSDLCFSCQIFLLPPSLPPPPSSCASPPPLSLSLSADEIHFWPPKTFPLSLDKATSILPFLSSLGKILLLCFVTRQHSQGGDRRNN